MSIIEVLVALGLVGILTSVIAIALQSMNKASNQNNVLNTIEALRMSIQRSLLDGVAWGNTLNDVANVDLACLRNNTVCTATPPVPADDITTGNPTDLTILGYATPAAIVNILQLRDGGNAVLIDSAPGMGFSDRGTRCTTWSAAGNDLCPIRYDIKISYVCPPGPATCLNPNIEAFGILRYSPNPNNPNRSIVSNRKYRIRLLRGSGGNYKAEKFNAVRAIGGGGAGGTGAGACPAGAWTQINGLSNPTAGDNEITPAGSATIAGANINLPTGTYNCSAMVTCFSCGSLKGRIQITGMPTAVSESPGVLVPLGVLGQAIIPTSSFTLNNPSVVTLQQMCQVVPAGNDSTYGTPLSNYGLGMAMADYATATIVSSFNCIKVF